MVACPYSSLYAAEAVLDCILLLFGHSFPKDRNAQMNSRISVVIIDTDRHQTLTRQEIDPVEIPGILNGWPAFVAINNELGMYVNDQPNVALNNYNALATQMINLTHVVTLNGESIDVYGKVVLFGLLNKKRKRDGKEHSAPRWVIEEVLRNPQHWVMMLPP